MALVYYPADYSEAVAVPVLAALHKDKLETAPANVGSATNSFTNIAANGSASMLMTTPPNIPGSVGYEGVTNFLVKLNVSTTNMNMSAICMIRRINSDGTALLASGQIGSSVVLGTATVQWEGVVDLGTWGPTDRLCVEIFVSNNNTMSAQSCAFYSDSVVTGPSQNQPGAHATWNDPDTTPPQGVTVSIDSGAASTETRTVSVAVMTTDSTTTGYEAKIWGDIDEAATEAAAVWEQRWPPMDKTLTAGAGTKTISAKLRDVDLNESAVASDTIDYAPPVADTTPPTVSLGSPSAPEISRVPGADSTDILLTASEPFVEYEARIVPDTTSGRTEGVLLETAVIAATNSYTIQITDDEIVAAEGAVIDGPKIIKVWVRDPAGNWSPSNPALFLPFNLPAFLGS